MEIESWKAKDILFRMVAEFPGLADGDTEVSGSDLVDWISNELHALQPIKTETRRFTEADIPF